MDTTFWTELELRLGEIVGEVREHCARIALQEAERYLANARACDLTGNSHGGTLDTACLLACRRVAEAIRRGGVTE